jgi:RsfA family transcription factor
MVKKGKGMPEWTKEEEAILAETVLRHIREGRTHREAYREASAKTGRTVNACEYRWKLIRSAYQEEIERAKEKAKKNSVEPGEGIDLELDFSEVIRYLERLRRKAEDSQNLDIIAGYEAKIRSLEAKLQKLREENKNLVAVVGTIRAAVGKSKD